MPIFEYQCSKCKERREIILKKPPRTLKCTMLGDCQGVAFRKVSEIGGVIFKGDGWTPKFSA